MFLINNTSVKLRSDHPVLTSYEKHSGGFRKLESEIAETLGNFDKALSTCHELSTAIPKTSVCWNGLKPTKSPI